MALNVVYFNIFFFPALQKRVSAMVRWGGGGEMVLLSGILKFHLYTLLEWGRNVFFFTSGKHLTTRDFCTTRGKYNSIYVHGSQACKLFQTVINSSSQIYKKLSSLIWCNFMALKWFCCEYLLEQHKITFVESKSFRAENTTVGVQTCDDHINDKTERNQDFR